MLELPLKVLVADDHSLFRQGLISLMRTRPDLVQVLGEAESGAEALALAQEHKPNAILLDIYMPEGDGLQTAARIREQLPETAIIMLTASELDDHVYRAVQLGAAGYLLKSLDAGELFDVLESVARGEVALTRAMAARLLRELGRSDAPQVGAPAALTERELDVLRLVAHGASNPQIAGDLHITVNTVKVHLRNILSKLQLENRTQAAAYAVQSGLVS
ncbi:MAG: response regulator transcription factor [Anaerolineae bacterium]|nr:response regulator transcription factor [Anaerolineae bacterium]